MTPPGKWSRMNSRGPGRNGRAKLFGGIDDDLTIFSGAFAYCANAGLFLQYEVHNAPFARGHGIESERDVCFAHPLGGNARRKFQFLDAQSAVTSGVEADSSPRTADRD